MKKVTAYQTESGKIFKTEHEAIVQQAYEDNVDYFAEHSYDGNGIFSAQRFIEYLFTHKESILAMLDSERPRLEL